MIRRVFCWFSVKCLEEGLCKGELTHRVGRLFGGSRRGEDLGQRVEVRLVGSSEERILKVVLPAMAETVAGQRLFFQGDFLCS